MSERLLSALGRAAQALAYYAPSHPVCVEARQEVRTALEERFRADPGRLSLATGGSSLFVDRDGPARAEGAAAALARTMLRRGLLGIRLDRRVDPDRFLAVIDALSAPPEPNESARLDQLESPGLELISVDFAGLFDGAVARLPPAAREDPVLERGLRTVIRFGRGGEPIPVRFESVRDPDGLGKFLEDLIERAEDGRAGRDEIADAGAEAFRLHAGARADLGEGAARLADALARLAPEARFELLRRLSEVEGSDLLSALGPSIDDGTVVDAIASALLEDSSEAVAKAVGRLLGRLRPVLGARRRLLAQVDRASSARGRPIDGLLWQSLEARTLGDERHGIAELTDPGSYPGLIRQAELRRRWESRPVLGQDVLHTLDKRLVREPLLAVYGALLAADGPVSAELAEDALGLAQALEDEGIRDAGLPVQLEIARRAGDSRELRPLLRVAVDRPSGLARLPRLVRDPRTPNSVRAALLLGALHRFGPQQQLHLRSTMRRLPPESFAELIAGGFGPLGPHRLAAALEATLATGSPEGLEVARRALATVRREDIGLVIDALVRAPRGSGLKLVGLIAGLKGPGPIRRLLRAGPEEDGLSDRVALLAVEALGHSDGGLALAYLGHLLVRPAPLLSSGPVEAVRLAAARALVHHPSPSAKVLIERARRHRAARRALEAIGHG